MVQTSAVWASREGSGDVRITKAVITAAGRGARQYPAFDTVQKAMLPLVDRDGLTKPVLQIIAEEALESGIEEICIVAAPGTRRTIAATSRPSPPTSDRATRASPGPRSRPVGWTNWPEAPVRRAGEPLGYGHAVWCAREFVAASRSCSWGDHLYVSSNERRCAGQLIDLAEAEGCAVSAVQATREHLIHQYGTISGRRMHDRTDVYAIDEIIEKPNPTIAELRLQIPGLRAGHYLCFFGMHVLTPSIFDPRATSWPDRRELGSIQLTTALNELARRERYLALETSGMPVQPRGQVRRGRGPDRPGPRRGRPRGDADDPCWSRWSGSSRTHPDRPDPIPTSLHPSNRSPPPVSARTDAIRTPDRDHHQPEPASATARSGPPRRPERPTRSSALCDEGWRRSADRRQEPCTSRSGPRSSSTRSIAIRSRTRPTSPRAG